MEAADYIASAKRRFKWRLMFVLGLPATVWFAAWLVAYFNSNG